MYADLARYPEVVRGVSQSVEGRLREEKFVYHLLSRFGRIRLALSRCSFPSLAFGRVREAGGGNFENWRRTTFDLFEFLLTLAQLSANSHADRLSEHLITANRTAGQRRIQQPL